MRFDSVRLHIISKQVLRSVVQKSTQLWSTVCDVFASRKCFPAQQLAKRDDVYEHVQHFCFWMSVENLFASSHKTSKEHAVALPA